MAAELPFADPPFQQRDIPFFPIPESEGVDVPREEILNASIVRLLGGILDYRFVVRRVAVARAGKLYLAGDGNSAGRAIV